MHSNRNLFSHGIQLSGMLMPPKGTTFTPEQAADLEKALARRFSGAGNAHRWAVFPYEYQVETPTLSPKDAEFLGALKWSLEDICRAYKVPLDLIGGQRSYENVNAAQKAMWTQCILPEARFIASEVTEQLLPMFAGSGVDSAEFDASDVDVLQEGHGEQWTRSREQIEKGAITVNEWREAEGLKPVPWGDVWWAPISVGPVRDDSEQEPLGSTGAKGPEPTAPIVPESTEPQEEEPSDEQPEEPRGMRMLPFGEAEHQRVCQRWERRGNPWQKAWGRLCADLFKRQKDSIIGRLKAPKRDLGSVADEPFNMAEWVKRFRREGRPLLAEMLLAFGAAALEDLGLTLAFDVYEPAVVRFLEQRAQRFAIEVNQTTWDSLKASLAEGIEAGDSMDTMAERVEAVMAERIRSSAETIARTEVNGAQNGGTLAAWEQSGVVEGKEWVAALDARTRDDHVDAHGQVVGIDEDFEVAGVRGPTPGQMGDPAQDCNCRCTMIAKVKGVSE
jgi:SPP1 gp7 family putative phage head morphogenesis protein